jgi:NAD(P)-dependent dehydrogenase (short-subunit alcohol dehydrogenase family)
VDVFCSNAGIGTGGGADAPDAVWQRTWEVNVMAHVWAARALVPKMIQRGGGYLLNTASAAGMLTSIGAAPYAVTKHAAVAMAEWLSITHGDQGVRVSVLAPLGVKTHLLEEADKTETGISIRASGPVLEPEQVADVVVKGMEEERFLILPHPEVAGFTQRKLADYEKWIQHMRKMQAKAKAEVKR